MGESAVESRFREDAVEIFCANNLRVILSGPEFLGTIFCGEKGQSRDLSLSIISYLINSGNLLGTFFVADIVSFSCYG